VGLRKAFVVKDTKFSDTFDQLSGHQPREKAYTFNNNNNNGIKQYTQTEKLQQIGQI